MRSKSRQCSPVYLVNFGLTPDGFGENVHKARPIKQTGANISQIPIPSFWPLAFVSRDIIVGLENEGWFSDGGADAATGNGAGAGNGDAVMLFELGKNSRCDGAWFQVGAFGLPMGGFWVVTGNEAGKFPGTADTGIVC